MYIYIHWKLHVRKNHHHHPVIFQSIATTRHHMWVKLKLDQFVVKPIYAMLNYAGLTRLSYTDHSATRISLGRTCGERSYMKYFDLESTVRTKWILNCFLVRYIFVISHEITCVTCSDKKGKPRINIPIRVTFSNYFRTVECTVSRNRFGALGRHGRMYSAESQAET